MRCVLFPVAVLAIIVPEPLWAEDENKKYDPKRVAALLDDLGDPMFAVRQNAEKELVKVGEPALLLVRKALDTTTVPEAWRRAERVERAILWGCCTSKACGLKLMVVDAGEFEMGSPEREAGRWPDETQHTVRLNRTFLIGKHEVTQAEYQKVTGGNPSYFSYTGGGKDKLKDAPNPDRFPVEQVSWFDAIAFCNRLSEADGFPAYYELTDTKADGDSIASATVKVLGGRGYRLPTEAEWEYTARATVPFPYSFGGLRGNMGNFKMMVSVGYGGSEERPSLGRTTSVASYKPNRLGLYDVHGNAAEWCHDWYSKRYYADTPADDPPGPDKGDHKVIRGGSWMSADGGCRSAARFYLAPSERKDYVGFRIARTP